MHNFPHSSDGPAGTLSWNVLIAYWRRSCTKWDRRNGLT